MFFSSSDASGCHLRQNVSRVLMINFLMIMEKAVCTSGLITLKDQKIKSNNYYFFVSRMFD